MAKDKDIIVGLDIGSSKICCIIARKGEEGLDVIGMGAHPSKGLRKGVVVNIEATVESIRQAVEEAETMAGMEIESVYVSVAGSHIRGINSHGVIPVTSGEVTAGDVARVIEAAQAVHIPADQEVLHVLSQEYIVDGADGIQSPIGINGVRLEAKVHIITGAVNSIQNIVRSVNRAGLEVNDLVVEQLAAAESTLDEDEKELGVALVDIGGGTSDIALFIKSAICGAAVVSLGGENLTHDIAIGLRTPNHEAEKIKRQYGLTTADLMAGDEEIEVPGVGGREPRMLSRKVLADIIEPRVAEIMTLIRQELETFGVYGQISSGVVLTGGGAMMEGMAEMGEAIFNLPVRIGKPRQVLGLSNLVETPQYATAMGLVIYGANKRGNDKRIADRNAGVVTKTVSRIARWVRDFF